MAAHENQPDRIRQLEQQVKDYELLSKALERISSAASVDDAIQNIVEEALQLCAADEGSIVLFGPHSPRDARTLIRTGEPTEKMLDHNLNKLLAGRMFMRKEPLLTNNLKNSLTGIKEKYNSVTSVLSVPLLLKGELTGVLNLIATDQKRQFTERELRLMTLLSNQCAHFIHKTEMYEQLRAEAARLKTEVQGKFAFHGIIGLSPKMQRIFSLLESVFPTDVRVLIEGASGTGKERIARVIHYNGPRQDGAFVAIDCGALPANLLESELFGYMKGAFTGANQDRKGLFEEANGGTLFLDEIGNMPLEIQPKLLRALQEGEIRPLGSSQVKKVDVRIIAATNEDLQARVKTGEFRQDLFFRLNVVNIALPPLCERKEDIPVLADHFLRQKSERYGKQSSGFQQEAMAALEAYAWPGNIRGEVYSRRSFVGSPGLARSQMPGRLPEIAGGEITLPSEKTFSLNYTDTQFWIGENFQGSLPFETVSTRFSVFYNLGILVLAGETGDGRVNWSADEYKKLGPRPFGENVGVTFSTGVGFQLFNDPSINIFAGYNVKFFAEDETSIVDHSHFHGPYFGIFYTIQ